MNGIVRESINFKRIKDSKKALNIGALIIQEPFDRYIPSGNYIISNRKNEKGESFHAAININIENNTIEVLTNYHDSLKKLQDEMMHVDPHSNKHYIINNINTSKWLNNQDITVAILINNWPKIPKLAYDYENKVGSSPTLKPSRFLGKKKVYYPPFPNSKHQDDISNNKYYINIPNGYYWAQKDTKESGIFLIKNNEAFQKTYIKHEKYHKDFTLYPTEKQLNHQDSLDPWGNPEKNYNSPIKESLWLWYIGPLDLTIREISKIIKFPIKKF